MLSKKLFLLFAFMSCSGLTNAAQLHDGDEELPRQVSPEQALRFMLQQHLNQQDSLYTKTKQVAQDFTYRGAMQFNVHFMGALGEKTAAVAVDKFLEWKNEPTKEELEQMQKMQEQIARQKAIDTLIAKDLDNAQKLGAVLAILQAQAQNGQDIFETVQEQKRAQLTELATKLRAQLEQLKASEATPEKIAQFEKQAENLIKQQTLALAAEQGNSPEATYVAASLHYSQMVLPMFQLHNNIEHSERIQELLQQK